MGHQHEQKAAPAVRRSSHEVPEKPHNPPEEQETKKGIWSAFILFITSISIEPMLFVRSVGQEISLVMQQKLKLERFCTVNLNYTEEECSMMDNNNHTEIQEAAQVLDNNFTFYETLIGIFIPLLILLFLGSWSDKHGRKIPLCLALCGYVMYIFVYILEAIFIDWPAEVLLGAVFLRSCGGGFPIYLMAAFSFISDRTSVRARSSRMAIMMVAWHLGEPIGTLLGAWLYNERGYITVFSTTLILYVSCILYVIIFLRDKIPKDENIERETANKSHESSCKSACNSHHVVDLTRTAFKSRPNSGRAHLLIVMTLMLFYISGLNHNMYLWSRRVLSWDQNQYSLWKSLDSVYHQVAQLCLSPFLPKIDDYVVGALQALFCLAHALWLASVTRSDQWWVAYATTVLSLAPGAIVVAIRSVMSKICDKDEIGKVFSLLAIMEIVYPPIDKGIYVAVYDATIDYYPSAEHLISASFNFVVSVSFVGLWFSKRAAARKKTCTSE